MQNETYYFPLYYKRLLFSCIGWNDEEIGAFIRLLIFQFDNGTIPGDEKKLKKIITSYKKNWPLLKTKFKKDDEGNLFNEVMKNVAQKSEDIRRRNVINGQKGGRPKANPNKTQTESDGLILGNPNGTQTITQKKGNLITNNKELIEEEEKEEEAAATTTTAPPGLTSEVIKEIATKAFTDRIWIEGVCMGNHLNEANVIQWSAMFNASLTGDNLPGFNERVYKKMFIGWLNKQRSKGYQLPDGPELKRNPGGGPPLKSLN